MNAKKLKILIGLLVALATYLVYTIFLSKAQLNNPSLIVERLEAGGTAASACHTKIGEFETAPSGLASHMEGAVGKSDGKFIVISGFSHYIGKLLIASSRVDRLDHTTLEWTVDDKPAPVVASHIQGAVHGNDVWIAGGFLGQHPGPASSQVWRFDTIHREWQEGPSLPSPRASGALHVTGDTLHYLSGLKADRNTDIKEHLTLNLTNPQEWTRAVDFPRARNHFQAVSINDVLFAVGGQKRHDSRQKDLAILDGYDPILKKWIKLADLPQPRSHAEMATFVFHDRIIVGGGRSNSRQGSPILDSIIEYNPIKNKWTEIGKLPIPLISPFVQVVDDHIYVTNGGLNWNKPQLQSWIATIENVCDQEVIGG